MNRMYPILTVVLGLMISPLSHAALPAADGQGQPLPTLAPMLQQVTPAVVNISTRGRMRVQDNPLLNDPFFRRFFDIPNMPPRERPTQSLGSGVVVDAQRGYVLTNNHVIANADEITVTLRDGRSLKARLIGTDPETDVAVIQIPAKDLTALSLADSSRLQVGDFAVAIGNPFGLGQTVTSGIISALGRTGLGIEGYEDFIQTDASINPGNSGGALVNLRGELIGINTAILAPGGGNIGIGFAIPINMARDIMTQLVESGKVRRGRLGLQAQDLTPELAQAFGLPLTDKTQQGAVIAQVTPGSPAAQAGLKPGDIVTAVNGQAVRDSGAFRNAIGLLRVGKQVKLDILRDGRTQTLAVDIVEPASAQSDNTPEDARLAGVLFGALDERSEMFGKMEGIPVVEVQPGSRAAEAGLRPGDIVTAVNRKPVRTSQEFADAVERNKGSLLLNVRRGEAALFIVIK